MGNITETSVFEKLENELEEEALEWERKDS